MLLLLLITQIGLKSDNLIISEFGKCNVPLFLSEDFEELDDEEIEETIIDKVNTKEEEVFNYMTEGLGAYTFGTIGFLIMLPFSTWAEALDKSFSSDSDREIENRKIFLQGSAAIIGSFCGVCLAGKLRQQEGSAIKAFTGALSVLVAGWLLGYLNKDITFPSMIFIPIGAVVGYNF